MDEFTLRSKTGPEYLSHAFAGTWDIDNSTDHEAVTALESIHNKASKAWLDIAKRHTSLMADQTQLPLANLQKSAAFATDQITKLEQATGHAIDGAEKYLAAIESNLQEYLVVDDKPLASEIRRHVLNIEDHEKREAFLSKADPVTLRAVLSVPAYLSGLVPPQHERHRDSYLTSQAPGLITTRDNLKRGKKLALNAANALKRHSNQLIDFKQAADLDALAKELA